MAPGPLVRVRASALRDTALGYALALTGHNAESVPLLQRALAATSPGEDSRLRAVLLGVLVATGDTGAAGKVGWPLPIPLDGSERDVFAALVFPRWLGLWPAAARDSAKIHDEYRGDVKLFFEPSRQPSS